MTFQQAVEAASDPVSGNFRPGKQALTNQHRRLVTCADPQRLTGSIDLDAALAAERAYAGDPRWDYGLGYRPVTGREQAIWVEVHSATTGEVSAVLNKLRWLKDWLNGEAEQLRRLTDRTGEDVRYVWIASAGVKITKNSPQARRLSQSGLRLAKDLALP